MMCNVYFFETNENIFFFDFIGTILLRCVLRLYFVDLTPFVEAYWYYKITRP